MGEPRDLTELSEAAVRLHEALSRRGLRVATAESLTGGGLADAISAVPGASATFTGGVVAYSAAAKIDVLGVSADTVAADGVVSAGCAAQMAEGTRRLFAADVAVSTTGVAGPDPQEGKPVGLVYVAVADARETRTLELMLVGGRAEIRAQVTRMAISAVLGTFAGPDV